MRGAAPLPHIPHIVDKLFGQPDTKQTMINRIMPNACFHPGGVHIDTSRTPNRIYILDSGNNRILGFNGFKGGEDPSFTGPYPSADIVIGQPSLMDSGTANGNNTKEMNPTAATLAILPFPNVLSTLEAPASTQMSSDTNGNLYVADICNNRVLKYIDPFETDQIADEVWGQTSFTNKSYSNPPTAHTLHIGPMFCSAVEIDKEQNLWVADSINNRVLRFSQGSKTANLVLGQSTFSENTGYSQSYFDKTLTMMWKPLAVKINPVSGEVFVLEGEWPRQARVLVFTPPLTNGKAASKQIMTLAEFYKKWKVE